MSFISELSERTNKSDRPTNFIQLAENIADDYDKGIVHGVQKDAIQNGWDALSGSMSRNNVSENWSFTFELIQQSDKVIFCMIDEGTVGLTGKYTAKDNKPASTLNQNERWARFESMAFNKDDSSGLGARGQGKMIFIHTSKDKCIFYDSLREDGTYRAGYTIAQETGCPVWSENEEEGRNLILKKLKLKPLNKQGSRIIIINPVDDLVNSVNNGDFKKYIEETWWPLIHKYGTNIYIKNKEETYKAELPDMFPIEPKKKNPIVKENVKFKYNNKQYNIKRLALAYDKDISLGELHTGIACFRNGMKIQTLGPYFTDEGLYGYAEFDKSVDELLYEVERPNHYGFRPNTGIWSSLLRTLKSEIREFEQEVLGIRLEKKNAEHMKSTEADKIAFNILRDLTKGWGLLNTSPHGTNRPPGPTPPPPEPVLVGVKINNLKFPNDENIPRVNYGDSLNEFICSAYNNDEINNFNVNLILEVLSGSGKRQLLSLLKENFTLTSGESKVFDNLQITIDKDIFTEPGKYQLRAKLSDTDTTECLHKISRNFWVETEPPLRNPFNVHKVDFTTIPDETFHTLSWTLQPEGDQKYTCWVNVNYPQYKQNAATEDSLGIYQGQIFFEAAIQILLRRIDNDPTLEGIVGPFNIDKIRNGDLSEFYVDIINLIANAKFEILK